MVVTLEVPVMQNVRVAAINDEQVQKLQRLEQELGVSVVAYEPMQYAPLSTDAVQRLQRLERELGVVLVAYPRAA